MHENALFVTDRRVNRKRRRVGTARASVPRDDRERAVVREHAEPRDYVDDSRTRDAARAAPPGHTGRALAAAQARYAHLIRGHRRH